MTTQRGRTKIRVTSALVAVLLFATVVAGALASKPIKGATYVARTAKGEEFSFKVAANGKKLTVIDAIPPLFCQGGAGGLEEVHKSLAISKQGTFKGTITYRVIHGKNVATLTIKGKFVASVLSGTLHSHWLLTKGCDGTTPYSASAVVG
jgi:hypothetical protein